METKTFTDGRTDGEVYNIIRPFFKRAYKNRPATKGAQLVPTGIATLCLYILNRILYKYCQTER